jgi:hypothetical protein
MAGTNSVPPPTESSCAAVAVRRIKPEYFDRHRDVLDFLGTDVFEDVWQLVVYVITNDLAHADLSGFGEPFDTYRNIDAIAENVVIIDDDVTDIDTDPKLDLVFRRHAGIALRHASLDVNGTIHGVHHAGKLQQKAVTGSLDDSAAVLRY